MGIIERREAEELAKSTGWLLIYGRRKVGKTFLVKRAAKWDAYLTVRRDGVIVSEGVSPKRIETFPMLLDIVKKMLEEGKTVVVDEFQRLPEVFLDEVATIHPSGRLFLVGSSMRIVERVVGKGSPLLGLAAEKKIGLISPADSLVYTTSQMQAERAAELASYLVDPWILPHLHGASTIEVVYNVLRSARLAIPALVGEVFSEDERQLTRVYDAILRAVGAGQWRTREIASSLYSRRVIDSADVSKILPYLRNMMEMDLVEAVPTYGQKEHYHHLKSPIMEAFYYLADRYAFDETDVALGEVRPTLEKICNLHLQNFVAKLFAELRGGRQAFYLTPSQEIDFVITVRRKPVLVGEVKWGKVSSADVDKFIDTTAAFPDAERVFVCRKKLEHEKAKILTPPDLVKLASEHHKLAS
jgi:AAA+ ATPase superfamily predicted ATPase